MKNFRLALLLCGPFCITAAIANEAIDRAAVVNMVQTFFDAMTDRDVDVMRNLLTADGIFYGYRETAEGLQITRSAHAAFVAGTGERNNTLIERFWDPQILLHDRMAVVWTPYDFYIDGEFSHCGIDNFNFLKTDQGWKITSIVFSMEPDNCAESPLGPLQN